MREKLTALAPESTIVSIEDWVKKGPVYDVLRAYRELKQTDAIDSSQPCIINYCDFYMTWDFQAFGERSTEKRL